MVLRGRNMGPNKLYYKDDYKDFPGSTCMLMRVI